MSETTCRWCGAIVQWGKTKSGKPMLFDVITRPHFISCKKRPKATRPDWYIDALACLVTAGHKTREARAMLEGIKAESVEEALLEAWKRKGKI